MIRGTTTFIAVFFSLNLMATEDGEPDYLPVNDWENQQAENESEEGFDPSLMYFDRDEDADETEYNQLGSPYEEADDFDQFYEDSEQPEDVFYDE
ncbi:hypothetical protein [Endozoicomonas euniceicola]|uniref:Secreted protein n=1 Tax=Endozoicomonas euniceicola TaxID=1234143 RepID=A0ABY6GR59_9GAMM|nr:hypothetical protein [Endozoicomonas euniceicola]UYM15047.1 hypothetical protein NX720_19565 [Endozoicomonas euniceicola]